MYRTLAIIERELRRFRRSPMLIIMSMVMPVVQLCVLGYAFGGNVKHLKVGIVDQDHGLPAVRVRELSGAVTAGARTFETVDYADPGEALADLRNGRINGVITIPPDFSRRVLQRNEPRLALIEDNTDNFVSATLVGQAGSLLSVFNLPANAPRVRGEAVLDVVEVYPYVPYVQYLLPGSIVMSIFMMVMIGGGIIFIDDKARGLHEGYLVTPITKLELIAGFNVSGTIKAVIAGTAIMLVGSLIAGVPNPLDVMRLLRLEVVIVVTSFALISLMFLLMVRVTDPLIPRATFGVLNTVLYFPSGAVYPQQGFPGWMQVIAAVDPFTYAVHALKSLLLKNTGFAAIGGDLLYLFLFSAVAMTAATILFETDVVEMESRDRETRDRLLSAAAGLFADRGFKRVTVRDICREAGANVAAVNYHFDDKLELYRQVLCTAVSAMRATLDAAQATGDDTGAEERLRTYIHVFLQRVAGSGRDSWIHRLMSRELADPTPALDVIVQQLILPRITYLRTLVAELLSCPIDDERVIRCAHSIHAQCVAVIPNPVAARLFPDFRMTPAAMTALAEHIASFSLAGVDSMRTEGQTRKTAEGRAAKDRAIRREGRRRPGPARPRSSRQL